MEDRSVSLSMMLNIFTTSRPEATTSQRFAREVLAILKLLDTWVETMVTC